MSLHLINLRDASRELDYRQRVHNQGGLTGEVSVVFTALSARLSLLVAMLPQGT